MPLTESDRAVIEVRDLLADTEDKDKVARVLMHRGMEESEAHALVQAVFKQNRSANRQKSFIAMLGSGAVVVALVLVWIFTERLFYIWLPLSAVALLWATVKFCTATGYRIEDEDE